MVSQYLRSNCKSIDEAGIVILGVPDESRSRAPRKGASGGPDALRIASNKSEFFERNDKVIPIVPMRGDIGKKKIHDVGNLTRGQLYDFVCSVVSAGKIPVAIGGDHSITTIMLKAIKDASKERLSVLYFDAHPDFVTSTRDYYGSVLADSSASVSYKKSVVIGMRAAEPEEVTSILKAGVHVFNPLDIKEIGLKRMAQKIKATTGSGRKYISIDLDCLDPAFAPGVSVPSPAGLSAVELIYLLKSAVEGSGHIAGIDIVELCPEFDLNDVTATLAARILTECIASIHQLPK